jgi:galactoside O-acetyltransferase
MTNPTVPAVYTRVDERPVRLGKHAIVGANAVILPGVVIGEGAAIGAQAIITKDVEPWAIVVGRNQKVGVRSQRLLELEAQLCAS